MRQVRRTPARPNSRAIPTVVEARAREREGTKAKPSFPDVPAAFLILHFVRTIDRSPRETVT